jgi:RNA polymerase sigma factor (sigma-70 family)
MATSQTSVVIQHLRRAVLLRDGAGLTDGQLLEDYIGRREKAALAALVRRHGPMVWGVCRRVLPNYHDAEDAFQATFLVLVRKAASIASRELLANWLYGVAHQTALKARATVARRKGRERQVAEMPEPTVSEQELWHDLQPLLDQELGRLPDKYRVVIVMCDLEAKTRKEAARQLGCPEGTVAGRLARARAMLAKRLARHGLTVSGGALAAILSQNVASASVPTTVVSCTIKAATLFAAGQAAAAGVLSVKVAALTEGVLKMMLLTKLKKATSVLIAIAIINPFTVGLAYKVLGSEQSNLPNQGQQQAKEKKQEPGPLFAGTVKEVDVNNQTIIVTLTLNDGKPSDITRQLAKNIKIVLPDGKIGKLTDLIVGADVGVPVYSERKTPLEEIHVLEKGSVKLARLNDQIGELQLSISALQKRVEKLEQQLERKTEKP